MPAPILAAYDPYVEDRAPVVLALAAAELTGSPVIAASVYPCCCDVDLMVCGSRGYGPLRSVLLGGVSRRLVDEARCPVLVLPRDAGRPLAGLHEGADAVAAP